LAFAAGTSVADGLVGVIAAAGRRMMWHVLDRVFRELQQIRQYDVSYQLDIGQNPSSADSTLTYGRGNARFWFLKKILETCVM